MRTVVRRLGLVAICLAIVIPEAHAATFEGQLWLLPNGPNGLPASFPPPSSVPDATFTAKHVSFFVDAPPDPNIDNSVLQFLNSAGTVTNLSFSGMFNTAVRGVVSSKTPVVDRKVSDCTTSYGTYMELVGNVQLVSMERVTITHDDGVSLKIDGNEVSGLTSGSTGAVAETFLFSGARGVHEIDLVYANVCGAGLLSFSPAM